MTRETDPAELSILNHLFGDNRAEWPLENFGDLFIPPAYFAKLETHRPCVLVGGRGTGKTTTLRSLRFDATLKRLEASSRTFGDQEYLGIYLRVNKSRVSAFQGSELRDLDWRKTFAHYFNLLVAQELTRLAMWLEARTGTFVSETVIRSVAEELAVPVPDSLGAFDVTLRSELTTLQLFVNNPQSAQRPMLSLADAPLKAFAKMMEDAGLTQGRTIFCCIDEYENLLDSQQALLNTYIKHAEPPLSYKIGVKRNGLRTRHTIDGTDLFQTPDDYAEIDIAREGFDLFATAVAEKRLKRAQERGVAVPASLSAFLEELSLRDEAMALGAEAVADEVRAVLARECNDEITQWVGRAEPTELYFLKYWSESPKAEPLADLALSWHREPTVWQNRFNNYGYSSLFWLSRGRKGARIRKYYSGARTILALAAGNIRYFLELLDESVARTPVPTVQRNGSIVVSARAQTEAARAVGRRRLEQLEGLAEHGIALKRLVLAIGKVFFELARQPLGRTPEVTSFVISGTGQARERVDALMDEGVSYLAFESTPRTKATTKVEMKDDEFRLHPIFCAFFEISHRRKRRTIFRAEDLLQVLSNPSRSIGRMLDGTPQSDEEELPEQLAFFTSFFKGGGDGEPR